MSISKAISRWRWNWAFGQRSSGIPSEDKDWELYLNTLTMSEVICALELYDEDDE